MNELVNISGKQLCYLYYFLVCCEIYDSESLSMMKNHASDLNSFSIEQKNSS